jgi:hypothetical protein
MIRRTSGGAPIELSYFLFILKWKKKHFAIQKNIFSLLLFLAGPLALHFKDDL